MVDKEPSSNPVQANYGLLRLMASILIIRNAMQQQERKKSFLDETTLQQHQEQLRYIGINGVALVALNDKTLMAIINTIFDEIQGTKDDRQPEKDKPTFTSLRSIQAIKSGDLDLFALSDNGEVLVRSVKFTDQSSPGEFIWKPFMGGGFCNASSARYLQDIDDHFGDPRSTASDSKVRRKYGGNPEERLR
jgi:hypothetical protein